METGNWVATTSSGTNTSYLSTTVPNSVTGTSTVTLNGGYCGSCGQYYFGTHYNCYYPYTYYPLPYIYHTDPTLRQEVKDLKEEIYGLKGEIRELKREIRRSRRERE